MPEYKSCIKWQSSGRFSLNQTALWLICDVMRVKFQVLMNACSVCININDRICVSVLKLLIDVDY